MVSHPATLFILPSLQFGFDTVQSQLIIGREPLEVALEANMMKKDKMATQQFFRIDELKRDKRLKEVAEDSGVPADWIFHSSTNTQLSTLQLSYASFGADEADSQEMSDAIYIVDDSGSSKPLVIEATSLTYYLNNLSLATVRIFTAEKYKDKLGSYLRKNYLQEA